MASHGKRAAANAASLMLAPMVVAMRLPILAAEARDGALPTETMRAATEKITAFTQGVAAAQMAYATAMWSFWPEVLTGRQPKLLDLSMTQNVLQAALAPSSRTVRSNFRRLSKKS